MEHISVIEPERIQRFGELDIVAVIPGIYPSCTPFGPPLPEEYGGWEWPWRELRETNPGVHMAWHSDFPFWSTNPFAHLYGFVTRKDVYSHYTCSPQEWLRDDTLSVEQALHVMTIDSAYALFREEEVGSLVPGKFADLIILSQNPLTREAEKLKDIKVLVTIVNGQFEYCAANQSALCSGYSNRVPATLPDAHPPQPVSWLIAALVVALPISGLVLGRSKRDLVIKIGGISGILSGLLLFVFYWVFEENPEFQEWSTLPVLVFLTISAAGMMLLKGSSRFIIAVLLIAIFGAIITAEGAILSVWLGQEDFWPIILVGAFILFAGLFLFGLANLKRRIFPSLNWVPFATVLLSILIPFLLRNFTLQGINWPLLMYTVIFGSGWVSMGILLLLTKEEWTCMGISNSLYNQIIDL